MTTPRLRIATRGSALARWQAQHVAQLLRGGAGGRAIEIELVVIETTADRRLDISIEQMGGKGVFVKEIQEAVLDGRADLAVHSAKDLPSVTVDGLVLASITERADPRDVLVGARYDALASGAHIATGAQRRRAIATAACETDAMLRLIVVSVRARLPVSTACRNNGASTGPAACSCWLVSQARRT